MRILLVFISCWLFVGCTSTDIRISSNPDGADVLVKSIGGGEFVSVGKTPLNTTSSEIEKSRGGVGPIMVKLQKEGFEDIQILVSEVSAVDVSITQELKKIEKTEEITGMNSVIDKVFEAQRLVKVKRLDDALRVLEEAQKEEPTLSAIYEVRGGIFYLQQNFSAALDSYRQAQRLNEGNVQVKQMIDFLIERYGDRQTASSTGEEN